MNTEISLFHKLWYLVRDLYAPTTSAPAAVKTVIEQISKLGHEACTAGKRTFLVDGELFEIRKIKGWSQFELIQHNVRIGEEERS